MLVEWLWINPMSGSRWPPHVFPIISQMPRALRSGDSIWWAEGRWVRAEGEREREEEGERAGGGE